MAKYQLKIKKTAEKEIANLPLNAILSIRDDILLLSDNPYPTGFKKLKGFKNLYRLQTGIYRIIYSVQHKELLIEIIKVAHRKDAYN